MALARLWPRAPTPPPGGTRTARAVERERERRDVPRVLSAHPRHHRRRRAVGVGRHGGGAPGEGGQPSEERGRGGVVAEEGGSWRRGVGGVVGQRGGLEGRQQCRRLPRGAATEGGARGGRIGSRWGGGGSGRSRGDAGRSRACRTSWLRLSARCRWCVSARLNCDASSCGTRGGRERHGAEAQRRERGRLVDVAGAAARRRRGGGVEEAGRRGRAPAAQS